MGYYRIESIFGWVREEAVKISAPEMVQIGSLSH